MFQNNNYFNKNNYFYVLMEALKKLQQRGFLLNETSYKLTNSGKRELLEICAKRKIGNMYEKCNIEEDITPEEKRELGYQTDEDVYLDPIDIAPIPKNKLIMVDEMCFNKDSLRIWAETSIDKTYKPKNPLNMKELTIETIEKLGLDPYDFKHTYRKELPMRVPSDVTLKDGKLHSYNDEPIIITEENIDFVKQQLENVNLGDKIWFKNGKRHRDNDKPAEIWYYRDGKVYRESWYKNGELHRDDDQPASIWYYPNGKISREYWYKNGTQHRDNDKPAEIWYYPDGKVNKEAWYKNGTQHRDDDQPAEIWYFEDGKVKAEYWYKNDKSHRDNDKPATIWYYPDGSVDREFWYKNGEEYFPDN